MEGDTDTTGATWSCTAASVPGTARAPVSDSASSCGGTGRGGSGVGRVGGGTAAAPGIEGEDWWAAASAAAALASLLAVLDACFILGVIGGAEVLGDAGTGTIPLSTSLAATARLKSTADSGVDESTNWELAGVSLPEAGTAVFADVTSAEPCAGADVCACGGCVVATVLAGPVGNGTTLRPGLADDGPAAAFTSTLLGWWSAIIDAAAARAACTTFADADQDANVDEKSSRSPSFVTEDAVAGAGGWMGGAGKGCADACVAAGGPAAGNAAAFEPTCNGEECAPASSGRKLTAASAIAVALLIYVALISCVVIDAPSTAEEPVLLCESTCTCGSSSQGQATSDTQVRVMYPSK